MAFSILKNLLHGARFAGSPYQSDRPAGQAIDLLIIHNISLPPGEFGTGCVEELFCNNLDTSRHPHFAELVDLRVSAHLLIDRKGLVTQFVPFHRKAWHAGESSFHGQSDCNGFSIGIELEGTDRHDFTGEQYTVLASITKLLLREYPGLNPDRIVGHSDVAPGRKTDPGPCFDWDRYKQALLD